MNDLAASRTRDTAAPPTKALGLPYGVGVGGFVDGILLHQILQWHHMVSDVDDFPPHPGRSRGQHPGRRVLPRRDVALPPRRVADGPLVVAARAAGPQLALPPGPGA